MKKTNNFKLTVKPVYDFRHKAQSPNEMALSDPTLDTITVVTTRTINNSAPPQNNAVIRR